jgi:hypothetical protein
VIEQKTKGNVMKRLLNIAIICMSMAALLANGPVFGQEQLRAGLATVDITPPIPYRMSGYFSERASTGTKDPLQAKAIVFRQGQESAAIVCCDLIGIAPEIARQAREQASQATGIPVEHIAISATHSHTGPLYDGAMRNHFHQRAIELTGEDAFEKVDYPQQLVAGIVTAIKQAQASLKAVILQAGNVEENRLSFNRRFHMKTGPVRFNPGQQNPDIIRVAGPIDPQVGIVLLLDEQRHPCGSLTSFALHLDTVGGTLYSADYPGYVSDILRKKYDEEFISIFGAGTCGDINHIDVKIKGRRSTEEIGSMLGETIAANIDQLPAVKQPSLAVRSAQVIVPLQQYSAAEIATAKENMDLIGSPKLSFLDQVSAYKITTLQERGGETIALEVQVFRLSQELAIVTLPGEVFVDLGLAIKDASPFATTLVIELTNDAPGYLPTSRAFEEGSYETVNSQIASGGAEKMVEAAIQLLKELSE